MVTTAPKRGQLHDDGDLPIRRDMLTCRRRARAGLGSCRPGRGGELALKILDHDSCLCPDPSHRCIAPAEISGRATRRAAAGYTAVGHIDHGRVRPPGELPVMRGTRPGGDPVRLGLGGGRVVLTAPGTAGGTAR